MPAPSFRRISKSVYDYLRGRGAPLCGIFLGLFLMFADVNWATLAKSYRLLDAMTNVGIGGLLLAAMSAAAFFTIPSHVHQIEHLERLLNKKLITKKQYQRGVSTFLMFRNFDAVEEFIEKLRKLKLQSLPKKTLDLLQQIIDKMKTGQKLD